MGKVRKQKGRTQIKFNKICFHLLHDCNYSIIYSEIQRTTDLLEFQRIALYRATSRPILAPFERYGHPKKDAKKSSCNTFSTYVSCKN